MTPGRIRLRAGCSIGYAVESVMEICRRLNRPIIFEFNGLDITVAQRGTDPDIQALVEQDDLLREILAE